MFFIQLIKEHSSSQGLFLQIIHSHNYPFLHLIKINVRCKNDKQQAKKEKGLEVDHFLYYGPHITGILKQILLKPFKE